MYENSALPIEESRGKPEFTIDPMFSGTQADGGKHREERHKDLEMNVYTPAEKAVMNTEEAL